MEEKKEVSLDEYLQKIEDMRVQYKAIEYGYQIATTFIDPEDKDAQQMVLKSSQGALKAFADNLKKILKTGIEGIELWEDNFKHCECNEEDCECDKENCECEK